MTQPKLYKRHRFPPEIIQYAVWLYYRFNLSNLLRRQSVVCAMIAERTEWAVKAAILEIAPKEWYWFSLGWQIL